MREILFRGKTKDGRWAYGSLILAGEYCCILESEENMHPLDYPYLDKDLGTIDGYATPVIRETVGQFVGNFVTTGEKSTLEWTRIFEGDILNCVVPEWPEESIGYRSMVEYNVRKGVVAYQQDLGEFRIRLFKNGEYWKRENLWTYGIKRLDVIGNIHDNSDLLEGKNR